MKQRCSYCLTTRTRDVLFEDAPGVWYCRAWGECKTFFARLPYWLR